MLARRLLIVLAVLLGMVALAAGVAPRQHVAPDDGASSVAVSPATTASGRVQRTLDASATGQRVVAHVGQSVVLVVRSSTLDTISVGDLGVETTEPDSPARFELIADTPGTYAIEGLQSGRRVGTLEVRGSS